ncbi:UbiA family prenyltransferase [Tateyamaria sp.]|uniref:UbiA family prenyltransferase n=1 Tax=Tateyamaria sp. TaxID=1929288 RepID=UPI00329D8189
MTQTEVTDRVGTDASAYPLVVDMDETLVRTDVLHEALQRLLVARPMDVFGLIAPLRQGKATFKAHVADRVIVPAQEVQINPVVMALIHEARACGRKVVLVSASEQRQVAAIAANLGVFDDAIGTGAQETGGENLSGAKKAAFLAGRYGVGQFDYVGDCATDLPVWKSAHRAYVVRTSPALAKQASTQGTALIALEATPTNIDRARSLLRALRPHQWLKNILVFLPILAAQNPGGLWAAAVAFVLFSLTASSVYIINDLVDLSADRAHPRKSQRPFASGAVSIKAGVLMAMGLLVGSAVFSLWLMPSVFVAVLAAYFAVTVAYSFTLKRKLIVDVITLAGLYTMRIIAGAAAASIVPSPWLVAFSMFLFFGLAAIKRQAELVDQAASGKEAVPGRGYLSSDVTVLQMMAISSGQAAVMVFALYLYSPAVAALYDTPEIMWLVCPIMLYWLSRVAILTHRGFMTDDPIIFAVRDRISQVIGVLLVLILVAAERDWAL